MNKAVKLSAVILTLNEADRIRPCLESLQGLADEIIVLDCGSKDATVAICNEYDAVNVIQTDWPGEGIQRQRMIDHANGEWLLWIDADERVSTQLNADIKRVTHTDSNINGYDIRWATDYFTKICIRGGLGDSHVRLFKTAAASFDPNCLVHPKVALKNKKISQVKGRLIHESFRNYEHLLSKNVEYSLRGAEQKIRKKKSASIIEAILRSTWRFIKTYFIQLGCLEGQKGLLNAIMASQYVFNKYAAIWASKQTK